MLVETRPGALYRIPEADFSASVEVFKTAMVVMDPADKTQRKAFEELMPYMYVLRNKGCTFDQLTDLLKQCGFKLQPSSVRTYYSEMLATRLDICQARMNEQIALMDALRKQSKGTDLEQISDRVSAVMEQKRLAAVDKVNAVFGGSGAPPARGIGQPDSVSPSRPAAARSTVAVVAQQDNRMQESPVDRTADSIKGVRALPSSAKDVGQVDADSSGDSIGRPAVATVESQGQPANGAAGEKRVLTCRKLQSGVLPLKPRDGVPEFVYKPGSLEHPDIPGLMLTLDERLYGATLEYTDPDGELHTETLNQKRFRVSWKKRIPMTETKTMHSFTKMDNSLFPTDKK